MFNLGDGGNLGEAALRLTVDSRGLSVGLEKAYKATAAHQRKVEKLLDRRGFLQQHGAQLKSLGMKMTASLTLPVAGFAAGVTFAGASFQASMKKVQAISGATGADLKRMSDQAKELGIATKFSAKEAADGMSFLAMAGYDANQILESMPGLLDLAAAGELELAEAADIASNVLSAFRYEADQTGRVSDVLAKTAASSNTSVQQLGQAFKKVAPMAGQLGLSVEETAAMIGTLGNVGVQASIAGTSLRTMMARLLDPSREATAVLQKLGVQVFDVDGKLRPLPDIVNELGEAGASASDLVKIFGTEGVLAATTLATEGREKLEGFTESLENAGGAAKSMAEVMMEGLKGAWIELQSAITGLMIAVADAGILDMLESLIDTISEVVRWMADLPGPVLLAGMAVATLVAAIGPLLMILPGLALYISALPVSLAAMGVSAGAATAGMGTMAIAAKGLAAAVGLLKVALFPVGLAVALAGVAIAVGKYIYDMVKARKATQEVISQVGKLSDNAAVQSAQDEWHAASVRLKKARAELAEQERTSRGRNAVSLRKYVQEVKEAEAAVKAAAEKRREAMIAEREAREEEERSAKAMEAMQAAAEAAGASVAGLGKDAAKMGEQVALAADEVLRGGVKIKKFSLIDLLRAEDMDAADRQRDIDFMTRDLGAAAEASLRKLETDFDALEPPVIPMAVKVDPDDVIATMPKVQFDTETGAPPKYKPQKDNFLTQRFKKMGTDFQDWADGVSGITDDLSYELVERLFTGKGSFGKAWKQKWAVLGDSFKRFGIRTISGAFSDFINKGISGVAKLVSDQFGIGRLLGEEGGFGALGRAIRKATRLMGKFLSTALGGFAKLARTGFRKLLSGFSLVGKAIYSLGKAIWNFIGGALGALGSAIFAPIFAKLKDLLKGLFTGDLFRDLWHAIEDRMRVLWESLKWYGGRAFEKLRQVGVAIWDGIRAAGEAIWSAIRTVGENIWPAIRAAGEGIWSAIRAVAESIWPAIKAAGEAIWAGIRAVAENIWPAIQAAGMAIWSGIQWVANAIWPLIRGLGEGIWAGIKAAGEAIWSGIRWAGENIWPAIKAAGEAIWAGIKAAGEAIWAGIRAVGRAIWAGVGSIQEAALAIWDGIRAAGEAIWSVIQSAGEAIWSVIAAAGAGIWDGLQAAGEQAWGAIKVAVQAVADVIDSVIKLVIKLIDKMTGGGSTANSLLSLGSNLVEGIKGAGSKGGGSGGGMPDYSGGGVWGAGGSKSGSGSGLLGSVMGVVNVVSGVVDTVAGFIQRRAGNATLGLIEENTRKSSMYLGEQGDDSIHGNMRDFRGDFKDNLVWLSDNVWRPNLAAVEAIRDEAEKLEPATTLIGDRLLDLTNVLFHVSDVLSGAVNRVRAAAVAGFNTVATTTMRAAQVIATIVSQSISAAVGAAVAARLRASSEDGYATGTDRVPRTGRFLLHEGEAVLSAGENLRLSRIASAVSQLGERGDNNRPIRLALSLDIDDSRRVRIRDLRRNAEFGDAVLEHVDAEIRTNRHGVRTRLADLRPTGR